MVTSYTTPGVYIEEQTAAGPIVGVGTSTAAFLGPALRGPANTPVKITNWTQFRMLFGDFMVAPRTYLAYAVQGFFTNGGTVAYILRVSNAKKAFLEFADRAAVPGKAIRVTAQDEGIGGNLIRVEVQDAQIVTAAQNASVHKSRAAITGGNLDQITLTNAADTAQFAPGDLVQIEGQAQVLTVQSIRVNQLVVQPNLTAPAAAGFVRSANLTAGQTVFRIDNPAGIEPGSSLRLLQSAAPNLTENVVVRSITGDRVTLDGAGLANSYGMAQADPDLNVTSYEFRLIITLAGSPTENYPNLSMDPRHSRYFGRAVTSGLVSVSQPTVPSVQIPPTNRPAVVAATALSGGADQNLATISTADYISGLAEFERVDDVNMICIPDRTDDTMHAAIVAHCELMRDRVGILDTDPGLPPFAPSPTPSALTQRAAAESEHGYAALYYPWITINDPASLTGNENISIPPSGHIAGIYARSDAEYGVHKAPANELVRGALDVELRLSGAEQGQINPAGVNALRVFPGSARPVVWGARSTAPSEQTAWHFINVRRLMNFIEESIQEGLRWAIFMPNSEALWKQMRRVITQFLTRVWKAGALFGDSPEQAFYVKIDEELNPPDLRALGQVIVEIGVVPVSPAEVIVVRIGIWEQGSDISET
ncbi:MAG: phage tail sheath subtilisin-like domain-containing protein [Thermomicrobiales bacterium]